MGKQGPGKNDDVLHLQVDGMMCQRNCGATVRNALLTVGSEAAASFFERRAAVVGATSIEEAVASVECVGFDAQVIPDIQAYLQDCYYPTTPAAPGRDPASSFVIPHGTNSVVRIDNIEGTLNKTNLRSALQCLDLHIEQSSSVQNHGDGSGISITTLTACFEGIGDDLSDKVRAAIETQGCSIGTTKSNKSLPVPPPVHVTTSENELVLQIGGMSCAVCTGRVERALQQAIGNDVDCRISVILANGTAVIEGDDVVVETMTEPCLKAVRDAGYVCEVVEMTAGISSDQLENAIQTEVRTWRRLLLFSVAFTVPLVLVHFYAKQHMTKRRLFVFVQFVLSTVVQIGVGKRFYISAYHGWLDQVLGMDFLICLGTTASYTFSIIVMFMIFWNSGSKLMPMFMTSAMLLSFVTMGKFLESRAKGQTTSALQTLMELQPLFAHRVVVQSGEHNHEKKDLASLETEEVSIKDVIVGDLLRVFPGARIPTDGELVQVSAGSQTGFADSVWAYVDESALTGEPFPVAKQPGDLVTGSTVNQLSALLVRVTAVGEATALSKIVRLMERAQRNKAPIQAFADRVACIFAPAVLVLAGMTFCAWLVFNNQVSSEERFFMAFTSCISVIVIACPCALGLATPTAVMVGTGVAARQGTLIKGGAVLESMHSVDTIIFDKTGTLTSGRAVLGADCSDKLLRALPDDHSLFQNLPSKVKRSEIALWLATCAETQSEHPLANAIVNAAKGKWGSDVTRSSDGVSVDDFLVSPGNGVSCIVRKDGWGAWEVRVGSSIWTKAPVHDEDPTQLASHDCAGDEDASDLRIKGQIAIYISVRKVADAATNRAVIGVFGILDPVQKEAASTVAALAKLGIDVWMCTGDHQTTALAVARQIGIHETNVCAGVTPEGKADLVTRLQRRAKRRFGRSVKTGRVAVVGDGINDSVALARADVGIAIGTGTAVATKAADVVLVRSSLHDVVVALHLSRVVFRRILLNFVWAMGYNLFALPFAAGIMFPITDFKLPPELAGLMMAFSSVSVVTSSLLLNRYRRPTIAQDGSLSGDNGCLSTIERIASDLFARCSSQSYENVPLKPSKLDLELV
jgi:P-type Cu+ transporter